jgi:hypothetical protein
MGMNEPETQPPEKRPVTFKSKKQIKEEWAKLDLPDLDKTKKPTEEHSALDEIYQDDIHGLGNE